MPYLGEAARYVSTSPNTNTRTDTFKTAMPAGSTVVMVLYAPVVGVWSTPTLTDSAGNTWTLRREEHGAPTNYQLAVFTSKLTTGVTTSTTWTATVTGANPAKWAVLGLGFDDGNGFDVSSGATGANSSPASGNTAPGAQDAELVVGVYAWTDLSAAANLTPTDGSTAIAKATATDRSVALTYRYVNAAGARSSAATLGTSQGWAAMTVAIKQSVAAANPPVAFWYDYTGTWVPLDIVIL